MKKNSYLFPTFISMFLFFVAWGINTVESQPPSEDPSVKSARIQEKKRIYLGPKICKPGSMTGSVRVFSAQNIVSDSELSKAIKTFLEIAKYNVALESCSDEIAWDVSTFGDMKKKLGADIVVFLVDTKDLPSTLMAFDDRWAVVNIARLSEGLPENTLLRNRLLASRTRRQLIRSLSMVCGACCSQFENSIMNAVKIEELDTVNEFVPVDVSSRVSAYMKSIGITPAYERYFAVACKEGWAPAPTNDIEKAIWTRIKDQKERGPSNPIRIVPKK